MEKLRRGSGAKLDRTKTPADRSGTPDAAKPSKRARSADHVVDAPKKQVALEGSLASERPEYVVGGDLFGDKLKVIEEVKSNAARRFTIPNQLTGGELEKIAGGLKGLTQELKTALLDIGRVDSLEKLGTAGPLDAS